MSLSNWAWNSIELQPQNSAGVNPCASKTNCELNNWEFRKAETRRLFQFVLSPRWTQTCTLCAAAVAVADNPHCRLDTKVLKRAFYCAMARAMALFRRNEPLNLKCFTASKDRTNQLWVNKKPKYSSLSLGLRVMLCNVCRGSKRGQVFNAD